MTPFWREASGSVTLAVKVQSKSRRIRVQRQVSDIKCTRLRIGGTEAAERGQAKRAACRLMAGLLDAPDSVVEIVQSTTGRLKTLRAAVDQIHLVQTLVAL